jgi:hypothetical protein
VADFGINGVEQSGSATDGATVMSVYYHHHHSQRCNSSSWTGSAMTGLSLCFKSTCNRQASTQIYTLHMNCAELQARCESLSSWRLLQSTDRTGNYSPNTYVTLPTLALQLECPGFACSKCCSELRFFSTRPLS